MQQISDADFIRVVNDSKSMAEAAKTLNLAFQTFKRRAQKLECYKTNQGGKGYKKPKPDKILTADILAGKYPDYQTYKLKIRLIDEGIFKDKCQLCDWAEKAPGRKYTACELHHKDGNHHNHLLENLILICPNCHSLTPNYRFRDRAPEQECSE